VLEVVFILLEFPSPLRRIFIGSHSLPPLWFAVSVLHGANREIIPHLDPGGSGSGGGSSNHGAGRRAGGGGDRGGRGHANSHASGASCGGFDARQKIEELRRKKSSTTGDKDGFPAFSARLRNLLLPKKFKPLGSPSTT
jgi:hypothetical protein